MSPNFSVVDAVTTFDTNKGVVCGVDDQSMAMQERI